VPDVTDDGVMEVSEAVDAELGMLLGVALGIAP
jgi:hypothetical protein